MADRYASEKKVERLETEIQDLRRAVEAQGGLIIELRTQIAPVDRYAAFDAVTTARASGGSPALRVGRVIRG